MKKIQKKTILPVLISMLITGFCILAVILGLAYQSQRNFESVSGKFLDGLEDTFRERETMLTEINAYNDRISANLVLNNYYLLEYDYDTKSSREMDELQLEFLTMAENSGLEELYLTDVNGKVLFAHDQNLRGSCLSDEAYFGQENWKLLTEEESASDELLGVNITRDGKELRYYTIGVLDDGGELAYCLIGGESTGFARTIEAYLKDFRSRFDNLTEYAEISAFAVNADTGIIEFTGGGLENLVGTAFADAGGGSAEQLADGKMKAVSFAGTTALFMLRKIESDTLGDWYFGTCASGASKAGSRFVRWALLIFFAALLFGFLSMLSVRGTGKRKMRRRISVIIPAAALIAAVFLPYVYVMTSVSQAMDQMQANAETFADSYESNQNLTAVVEKFYEDRNVDTLKSSASYLEAYGESAMDSSVSGSVNTYVTRNENGKAVTATDSFGNPLKSMAENSLLSVMAEDVGEEKLLLINSDGKTISASDNDWFYDLSDGEKGFEDELFEVLDRRKSYFYTAEERPLEDNPEETRLVSCFAQPVSLYLTKGEDGSTVYLNREKYEECIKTGDTNAKIENGLLYAEAETPKLVYLNSTAIARDALTAIRSAQNSEMALLESGADGMVCGTDGLTGQKVSGLGYGGDGNTGESYSFVTLDGIGRFAGLVPVGQGTDYAVLTLLPDNEVFQGIVTVSLTGVLGVLLFLTIIAFLLLKNEQPEEKAPGQERKLVLPQNAGTAGTLSEYFRQMKPEQRISTIFRLLFFIIFAVFLWNMANSGKGGGDTALRYTLTRKWERGFSLFSVTYAFYILAGVMSILYITRKGVQFVVPLLGTGTETVLRICLSLVEYVCVLVLVFYNLYLFGVQMGTVMTSAGIMTIVVGLGANSLISDVLAGLFIIVEQEYKVGDIITIDGFTGTVRSIGLRTTKVQDFSGNIKTFNNAKINGVLNLTDNYTTFFVTVNISIQIPVDTVEKLVNTDLKKRMEGDRDIVAGPWFSGIPEIKGNVYTISVGASSLQQNSWTVRKKIIQQLLVILRENNIPMS